MARAGAKPQRTDLVGKLPVQTAKGQAYGQAKAQEDAQKAIPMAPPPTTPPAMPAAPAGPLPGDLPALTSPSQRPHEPITHGLSVGPGGGPEVMPSATELTYHTGRDLVAGLAQASPQSSINTLLAFLNNGQ